MPKQELSITSILGGISPTSYFGADDAYLASIGIDPDFPTTAATVRTSGLIMPTRYEKFSTANIVGSPAWIITNPKDTNVYVIANNGQFFKYDSTLTTETIIDSGTIGFDAVSGGTAFAATTTKTVSHTASGSNRVAIVDLAFNADVTGVSVTYGGVAMTLVASATGSTARDCHMFYLIAPATGAQNVIANWTGSASGWLHVRTYTGVHQTTAIGTPGTQSATGTTPSVTVSSAVGELVVDALATNDTPSVGAGQTSRYIESTSTQSGGSEEAGATSVTMSWSQSSQPYGIVAVPLKPAAAVTNYGNGAAYYNNYIYTATPTDIDRYGPLSGTPIVTRGVWTGATLGSQPALIASTYPQLQGVTIPSHPMHVHTDNILYVGDFNTVANPGKGSIHKIKTTKTTNEGDTNDSSDNDILALPFGFRPVDIESFNTDLAILAIQTSDTTINQGKAALFLWDTTSISFYAQIALPDPIGTALQNVNGVLNVWTGNATNGIRLSRYTGGYGVSTIVYQEEGTPPLAGATDAVGDRISYGTWMTYPSNAGSVFSYGSKDSRLPASLNCTVRSTAGTTTPIVTALKYVQQANNIQPRLIVGWGNGTTYGLDKLSTTAAYSSVWRSKVFNIGTKFRIERIRIPLTAAVDSNTTITIKAYMDDASSNATLATINNTDYSGQRYIVLHPPENVSAKGENNFFLEASFTGTSEVGIGFPIDITLDVAESK